ncbi:MAG TPA: type II toxin-antitoxin system RelE/ParE family toxin [Caulobacteraceae bacterium]
MFKTAWFSKAARKAGIADDQLRAAMLQVVNGQADDLGGGVFKKRLNRNLHRGIVVARGGANWVFAYLFAKKDRANVDDAELAGFRRLAKSYEGLSDRQIGKMLSDRDFVEITDDDETKV